MGLLDLDEDGTDSRVPRHSRRWFCQYLRHRYPAWRSKQEEKDAKHETSPSGMCNWGPALGLAALETSLANQVVPTQGFVAYDSL